MQPRGAVGIGFSPSRRAVATGIGALSLLLVGTPRARGSDVSIAAAGTPSGVYDQAALAQLPGILPTQSAPPAVVEAVQTLADQHDAITRNSAVAAPAGPPRQAPNADAPSDGSETGGVPGSPDALQAPPAMDSGSPDPDRLNAPSIVMSVGQLGEAAQ